MLQTLVLIALAAADPLYRLEEPEIDARLQQLVAAETPYTQRVVQIALECVGTPYFDGPLGEGPDGKYDTDPLVDLKRVDCVTYVEQTLALATASSFLESVANLQHIRYRKGQIDFETRNHFMISDWIRNNPHCRDVSTKLGVETNTLTRTISKKDFFQRVNAPDLGQTTPDESVSIDYVPSENAAAAEPKLPSPSLIVFIGQKPDWLFALHCGLYIRDSGGEGALYHASSKHQKVVAVPLTGYLKENDTRYLGFTAYQIAEPSPPPTP